MGMTMNHIFIYGPPGSGKTTIGEMLARHLVLPFIDLDLVIETNTGTSIPKIMERKGESDFRDLETATLKAVITREESVIALGGGSLLRDDNREIVEDNGRVVLLKAERDTLLNRLNSDSNKRPLLMGDLRGKLSSLLAKRGKHYNSFPLSVHVDGKTAEQNVHHIQIVLGRYHLSAMGQYDVIVQINGLEQIADLLYRRGLKNPIVVTDENVVKLHAGKVIASLRDSGINPNVLTVPVGEAYKTLDTMGKLWHGFIDNGLDRKSTVIALGGGVVGDLAGFAAATFMRGVSWVAMPTTLLSMVDASLGGKTGFDLPEGKNLIGSFFPPKLVLADPQVLKTLPEVELISGLAEVVKTGIISDPELFNLCAYGLDWVKDHLEEIVKRAMAVKIQIIEEDPYERGFRAALNFGHTVGHAVELVSRFQLRHGEAVAIGMVAEAKLAERLTVAGKGVSEAIAETLSELSLPIRIPKELPREELIRAMRVDKKKSNGIIRFSLPAEIGRVELVEVENLEMVLEEE
jgi:shikimate kinase / 3-dehydroquinate synthase